MSFMKVCVFVLTLLSSTFCFSQVKWHPYIGVHGSMDAEGYYVGPSIQLGTDYLFKDPLSLSLYFHFFPDRTNKKYNDGTFEKGKYSSATIAILIQRNLSAI